MAEGPLPCVPTPSGSTSSPVPWQALSHCPPVLGGQFTPRTLPPRPSDCLVLQPPLPCAPGDLLAASSWGPRPQTPPTLQFETPFPANVLLLPGSLHFAHACVQHSPTGPRPPFLWSLPKDSWALPAVQPAARPSARLARGATSSLSLAAAQARDPR